MNAADPGAGKKAINGARIIVTKIGTGPAGIESRKHERPKPVETVESQFSVALGR